MRTLRIFAAGVIVFIGVCFVMAGVIGPAIEAWAAFVLASTGSPMLANIALVAPFAAFFGLCVALTA